MSWGWGTLTPDVLKHDWLQNSASIMMLAAAIGMPILITYLKRWKWLWNEWITTLDPKKIGVMYLITVLIVLFKCLFEAGMMRVQQSMAVGDSFGYMSSNHFQSVFSAHGTGMVFLVGMGTIIGMMNLILPLQIGARDVAFPFLNSISFWTFVAAALLINISLAIGDFSAAGWLAYPPLSSLQYSPKEGVDYWIWLVQISGASSLTTGINFVTTVFKMRAPGMKMMDIPLFVWGSLGALILIIFAFPVLTATLAMLALDRYLNMHFFTPDFGGNFMMYVNLIWAWGHPEVYILILPSFGLFSDVVTTFSRKSLFGYTTMIWAIILITFLSFVVWVHHFFTMGAGPGVNSFFSIMTMLIAIPTGVKIYNWLFTMRKGKIAIELPMYWFMGFLVLFTIGGMTGVLLSIPPIDFQMHNSLFLIAHFHNVLIGGTLFGFFTGITFWFPKVFGIKLHNTTGKWAFWCWFLGFLLAFMPLYILGLMGATRRLDHYPDGLGWHPLFMVAAVGFFLIVMGVIFQNLQILLSILKPVRDTTGDIWHGRTLEWMTSSPPPFYNFAVQPHVTGRDYFWTWKHSPALQAKKPQYEDIQHPKNSALGFYIGMSSLVLGFGLIWHIWWMAILGLASLVSCLVIRFSRPEDHWEHVIPADVVEKIEKGELSEEEVKKLERGK